MLPTQSVSAAAASSEPDPHAALVSARLSAVPVYYLQSAQSGKPVLVDPVR